MKPITPSRQRLLGWLMAPLTWLAGIPWSEAPTAGGLMGTKTALNEFIAYVDLSKLPADALSPRSRATPSTARVSTGVHGVPPPPLDVFSITTSDVRG